MSGKGRNGRSRTRGGTNEISKKEQEKRGRNGRSKREQEEKGNI